MKSEKDETVNYIKLETKFFKLLLLKDYASFGKVRHSIDKINESRQEVSFYSAKLGYSMKINLKNEKDNLKRKKMN